MPPANAGIERPLPDPVAESPDFARAVASGTRTRTGRPGPGYWQQWSTYVLSADIDPVAWRLTGRASIRYENRSPDTLHNVYLHLYHNLYAPGAMRNEETPVTTGTELRRVVAAGVTLAPVQSQDSTGYQVAGTILRVRPARPVAPGQSIELGFSWALTIPPDGAPREGQDGEVAMVAYWYPQVAVYDDVFHRWQTDAYLSNAEFYMGYGDYDVSITVPEGWLVGATGTLANAADVLSAQTLLRLGEARRSAQVVRVVTDADRGAGKATATSSSTKLTWRFVARGVRDFAFGTSAAYLWDATHAVAGDATGDGRPDTAEVHTFYRPSRRAWAWGESARYTRHSVEFLSGYLWPYPYPAMTAVDGVASCTGMEYPMLTCVGGRRDSLTLYSVIVHETGHMWFPMQVGSDEKRYAWQDEGLTRFNQTQALKTFYPAWHPTFWRGVQMSYASLARAGGEVELMRHGDLYPPGPSYAVASYQKMALTLHALRALLGEDVFNRAYREYGRRWVNKHPTPFDLFNTFNEVSGRDLSWFWRTWFYETWPLDQAVAAVDGLTITIEDRGLAPMPARLVVTRADGSAGRLEVPVETWLAGARRATVTASPGAAISRVEIDPGNDFPDVDRANNIWPRS